MRDDWDLDLRYCHCAGPAGQGYNKEWYARIVKENGKHYEVPETDVDGIERKLGKWLWLLALCPAATAPRGSRQAHPSLFNIRINIRMHVQNVCQKFP